MLLARTPLQPRRLVVRTRHLEPQSELRLRGIALPRLCHHLGVHQRIVLQEDRVFEPVLEIEGNLLAKGTKVLCLGTARVERADEVHDVDDSAHIRRSVGVGDGSALPASRHLRKTGTYRGNGRDDAKQHAF